MKPGQSWSKTFTVVTNMGLPERKPSKRTLRYPRWAIFGVATLVLTIAILELIIWASALPESMDAPPQNTPVLYDREGGILAMLPEGRARIRLVGHLPEMGPWLPEATVALEDHRFYAHSGIDAYAIAAAAWSDIKARRLRRGGSTITQQLIKQELGTRGRQWRRKWREAILALKLERSWSKADILQGYLNRLDYGNRRFGAEAAALAYFGKRCAALTLAEAIYLAGLPQAPSRYNPWRNPQNAERKYRRSIHRLTKVGYLTAAQSKALLAAPPRPGKFITAQRAPHFLDALQRSQSEPLRGSVLTSLDPAIQARAEDLLEWQLSSLDRPDVRNGAIVVLENATGRVLALSARATDAAEDTRAINAALTPRHAGSTLKPFVYQQALEERRYTAASVLTDTARAVADIYPHYDPKNFNQRYYGPVRLREALGNSLNVPAIIVSHRLGPRRAFDRLKDWGLPEHDPFEDDGAGFVLGNRRVTLIDLTFAYSTLARGGLSSEGPIFRENTSPALNRMTDADACRLIEDILSDNGSRIQSFGPHSRLRFPAGQRTAVKTGTSSNFRDAWVVGYNATHAVGVWVGNLDGRSMKGALAVDTAGPIWRQMMDWLVAERQSRGLEPLEQRRGIVGVEIDALTGWLPTPGTRRTITEWFLPGTQPRQTGERWYRGDSIVLPNAYASWCQSLHNHLGAVTSATASETRAWVVTSPRDDARYLLDPAIPREQQVLAFATDHPQPKRLLWYLNGERLSSAWPLRWPLAEGSWLLRSHDPETGRDVQLSFVVEF